MNLLWITSIIVIGMCLPVTGQEVSPYQELIQSAGDAADHDGADLVRVFDSTWVDVEQSGLSHKRVHTLTRILTTSGVASMRSQRFDYDPASNKIKLTIAKIHREDGTIEDIDLNSALDLPQPQRMIYWGARMMLLPIPPLEVGDAVELESTTTGFMIAYLASDGEEERYIPPMRGTYYDVILFGGDIYSAASPPMKLKSYTVTMPKEKVAQYETYNGEVMASMTFDDEKLVYSFWMKDVPAYHGEPRAPDASDVVPKVVFTNVRDWAEKSRWFYWANEDSSVLGRSVFDADDAIRRKVREITSSAPDDTSKIHAILHWVAQNIRYSGITMGEGEGYTLHPSTEIFRDRCGVCKDIAGMCVTMLREAGFEETYPVMTMAGSRVERIPADQFNHCVVAMRKPDGSFLMVDPTWSPFNMELWSRAESEQHYVVGSPEGEGLGQVAKYAPEDNDFSMTLKTTLDEDGTLTGTVRLQGKSYGDARVRRPYSDAGRDQWDEICRDRITAAHPRAEMTFVEYGDLWNLYKPFTVKIGFKIERYARSFDGRMDYIPFSSQLLWAGGYHFNNMTRLTASERTQPVLTWNPRQSTLKETVTLPTGYHVGELPDERDVGGDIAWTKGSWSDNGRKATYEQVWHVSERMVPAESYEELKESIDALQDHDTITLALEQKGGAR